LRTTLATTTEQPAELNKETPSLSYAGAEGTGRLRATWRGPVSGLRFSLTLTVKGEDSSPLVDLHNKQDDPTEETDGDILLA
jgi:hypothetical protein